MTSETTNGTKCPQCGDHLIASEFSQYEVATGAIHHSWRCSKCAYKFETSVDVDASSTLAPELVDQFLPNLLVA